MNAFQILSWFDFTEIGVNLIENLYATVGKVYEFMIQLTEATDVALYADKISQFVNIIYALAGVFMLFRITVSLIQYLINPDQITDKGVGGGKLLVNIIVTVVLLILFYPSGIVYNFLDRIQDAMIGENGFINNILSENLSAPSSSSTNESIELGQTLHVYNTPFIEDVYAASMEKPLTCYFVQKPADVSSISYSNKNHKYGIIKLTFSSDEFSGRRIEGSVEAYRGYIVNHAGETQTPSGYDTSVKFINYYGNTKYRVPKGLYNFSGPFLSYYPKKCSDLVITPPYNTAPSDNPSIGVISKASSRNKDYYHATSGGYATLKNAYKRLLSELGEDVSDGKDPSGRVDQSILDDAEEEIQKYNHHGISRPEAWQFANAVASTFYTCEGTGEDLTKCNEFKEDIFVGADTGVELIEDEQMSWDFFISILMAIGLIIFLIILCVEVILRNLKLVVLQMIAPIPIINGIDPKDKMRSQWIKMYFSVYLELFLKLFAIKLVIELLAMDMINALDSGTFNEFWFRIFYVIALLVFAKTVPNLLSKIFGIEGFGGTMGQIGNMLKTAAGAGVGAAIGGAVGAGAMAGTIGSAWKNTNGSFGNKLKQSALAGGMGLGTGLSSAIRGIGAGSKGNVLAGGKNAVGVAGKRMADFRDGLPPSAMVSAATLGRVGQGYAQRVDKSLNALQQEQERLSDVNKVKSEISNIASGSDFGTYVDNLARNGELDPAQAKTWKDKWVDAQIASYNGDDSYYKQLENEIRDDSIIGGYSGDIVEKGKQAQIRQQMTDLNNMISGDKTISNVVGADKVTYYARSDKDKNGENKYRIVKDVDTKANQRKEKIFDEISEKTQTSEYRVSKAANDKRSGNNNG